MLGQQQIQKELSQIKSDLSLEPSLRKSIAVQNESYSQNDYEHSNANNLKKKSNI